MINPSTSYSKDIPLWNFLESFFNSTFTVTAIASLLKILGIFKGSWLLTTSLLWLPPAILVGLISFASVCFYVGFAISMLANFIHRQIDGFM